MKKIYTNILLALAITLLGSCEEDAVDLTITQPALQIAMTRGGTALMIPNTKIFAVDPAKTYINIPLGISLSTVTLDSFAVNVSVNNDTINQLISAGSQPNTILLPAARYTLPASVTVPANTISAPLNLKVDFNALTGNPGKKLALAVRIGNPSSHTLKGSQSTTVVIIDVDAAIDASELGDVTAKYLKNTGFPFISTLREGAGGRWGNLDHWTANAAAKSHGGYGGFNRDAGGTMGLEAGWGSPAIMNGKLYQTTTLPAGKYAFEVTQWDWKGMKDPSYLVVAAGNGLPDIDNVGTALSASPLANSKVEFTLAARQEVSLGVVVNFPASGQGFKIKQLKLTRLE